MLWHSLFVDERSWQRVTAELAQDRRLIVITGPGHGSSSDPGRRFSLVECARSAAEVLDSLGVAEPVDWVGNAWGGHVGVRFATEAGFTDVTIQYVPWGEDTAVNRLFAAVIGKVVGPIGGDLRLARGVKP